MYDPDLHLFLDDSEITVRQDLYRMIHPVRRESLEPVLAPDPQEEGTAIGYATVVREERTGPYKLWYMTHKDMLIRLAVSHDGRTWQRRGLAVAGVPCARADNLGLVPAGPDVAPWFAGAKLVGYGYFKGSPGPNGLHTVRSVDGEHIEVRQLGILPGVGDRSSIMFDEVTGEYSLISRPSQRMPGFRPGELKRPRVANLWKSRDLMEWRNCGVVLKCDELDRHDVQIYGMQPFRYGKGFLALVEVYYAGIERLETQLASSLDGVRWQRTGHREPVLALGGEGAWDSHWVVSTYNPPIPEADRLLIFYSGADTKHASGARHRRAIGLASIRRDGWVSLEAGRTEGVLVTTPLSLGRPMKLELNVNCHSGRLSAEVIPAVVGRETDPLPGYEGSASAAEGIDQVSHRVCWGERSVVAPIEAGRCHLRFCLQQASFFSYRWAEAT